MARRGWVPSLRWLGLLLLALGGWASGAEAPGRVEVSLKISPPTDAPLAVELAELEGNESQGEKWSLELSPGTQRSVSLRLGSRYRVHCPDEQFWCEEQEIVAAPGQSVELRAVRRAMLEAELLAPRGVLLGLAVELEFRARGEPGKPGVGGRLPCTLEDSRLACRPPGGVWDLRLRPKGWAPSVHLGVELPAGGKKGLGSIPLRPGGAITGWIEVEGDSRVLPRCRVWASPVESIGQPVSGPRAKELAQPVSTVPDRTGAFALSGLAPGAYELEASCPPNRKGKLERVPVHAGGESRIPRGIPVRPPRSLVLIVDPPVDPSGAPWGVTLTPLDADVSGSLLPDHERNLSFQAGRYRLEGLDPGLYVLTIKDVQGAVHLEEEVLLEDSMELERTLDLVEVEGRVTRAGEPLRATVWWGGSRRGIPGVADADGTYRVLLPAQRKVWSVEVTAEGEILGKWGVVPLPRPDSRGRRIRNFDLGLGVLEVRCRTAGGEVAPGCRVTIWVDRAPRFSTADNTGRARFEGLRAGTFFVEASAAGESSCWVERQFPEGKASEEVDLDLQPVKTLGGWVGVGGQPLSGVPMRWSAFDASGKLAGFGNATSDAAGNFSLTLCSQAASVELKAFPPGRSLMALRRSVGAGGFLLLESPEGRASLELLGPDFEEPSLQPWWLEFPGEGRVDGFSALHWASANGYEASAGRVVIPALPPGTVKVCWAEPVALEAWEPLSGLPQAERCETVRLREGELQRVWARREATSP